MWYFQVFIVFGFFLAFSVSVEHASNEIVVQKLPFFRSEGLDTYFLSGDDDILKD